MVYPQTWDMLAEHLRGWHGWTSEQIRNLHVSVYRKRKVSAVHRDQHREHLGSTAKSHGHK
jgi:hypothetical protein